MTENEIRKKVDELKDGEQITIDGTTYLKCDMDGFDTDNLKERLKKVKEESLARMHDSEYQYQQKIGEERRIAQWRANYNSFFFTKAQKEKSVDVYSTDFIEFRIGRYNLFDGQRDDSIYCYGGLWDDMHLDELFLKGNRDFDFYDNTEYTPEQWNSVIIAAFAHGGIWVKFVNELTPWVNKCFECEGVFTICGE